MLFSVLSSPHTVRKVSRYLSRDTAALDALANHDIPELLERLKRLHGLHRTYWFATNKPEGFDITELPGRTWGAAKAAICWDSPFWDSPEEPRPESHPNR